MLKLFKPLSCISVQMCLLLLLLQMRWIIYRERDKSNLKGDVLCKYWIIVCMFHTMVRFLDAENISSRNVRAVEKWIYERKKKDEGWKPKTRAVKSVLPINVPLLAYLLLPPRVWVFLTFLPVSPYFHRIILLVCVLSPFLWHFTSYSSYHLTHPSSLSSHHS